MTKDNPPAPDHLAWVITGRARTQKAALNLYKMIKEYGPQIRSKKLSYDAQDLAAVAFSLWRAVFLADRSGAADAKMADVEFFLGKMLTDNRIAWRVSGRSITTSTMLYFVSKNFKSTHRR